MKIIERIFNILDEKGRKAQDLCELLDLRSSTISSWKTRNTNPPAEYLPAIARYLGVSLDYLMTGEESPASKTTTTDEDMLLELFRELPENKKYEFIGELKGFLKALNESQIYVDKEKRLSVWNGYDFIINMPL